MASAIPSIASLYRICIQSFGRLRDLLKVPGCEFSGQVSLLALEDELGRLKVWAGNVGAHRDGRVSLDHRLREASGVHNEVTELLEELNGAVKDAIAIVSHERQPFDQLSWSSDSSISSLEESAPTAEPQSKLESTTELQERFSEITHVITCLYRFSIAIRNPVPRDRLQKCASIDVSHYEFFDIQHTSHKFPNAEKYLIDRLGKANSRRRQLFKYHERHHDKLTRYIELPQPEGALVGIQVDVQVGQPGATNDKDDLQEVPDEGQGLEDNLPSVKRGPKTIATTVNTQTTVSTYVQGLSSTIEVCSDAGQSQTSYATSVSGDTESKLRVPPPPKPESAFDSNPFECPYCFSIITVRGSKSWMKHVFRDLRPYICTFKDCPKPERLFDSRHDWYGHEVEVHRREWFCNACRHAFPSKTLFKSHLRQSHLDLFAETQLPAMVERCERAIDGSDQACPLCRDKYTPRRLESHLARHMQQLALFTLPKTLEEVNGDGESAGAQASKLGEEETEGSLGPDLSSTGSSQGIVDAVPGIQNEIPGTQNETWGHLTDPEYKDLELKPIGDAKGTKEPLHGVSGMEEGLVLKEAEDLQLHVLASRKRVLGDDHPETLTAMAELASTFCNQERYGEAGELQEQVVSNRKRVLGDEHPETLTAMTALASTFSNQGRYEEAGELQARVVASMERDLGLGHSDTLTARNTLLSIYSKQEHPNPQSGAPLTNHYHSHLTQFIKGKNQSLEAFFPGDLDGTYAERATTMAGELQRLGCPDKYVNDLIILTLYDVVALIDDSTSMRIEDDGSRIIELEKLLSGIAEIYSLARPDGITSTRFLNYRQGKKNVKKPDVPAVVGRSHFCGLTMIGTELQKKVIAPFLGNGVRQKPLLVIVIMDGDAEGERDGILLQVMLDAIENYSKGQSAVAFQFSQVGDDPNATRLLNKLLSHSELEDYVDCTQASPHLHNTEQNERVNEYWALMSKILLGAIIPKWKKENCVGRDAFVPGDPGDPDDGFQEGLNTGRQPTITPTTQHNA